MNSMFIHCKMNIEYLIIILEIKIEQKTTTWMSSMCNYWDEPDWKLFACKRANMPSRWISGDALVGSTLKIRLELEIEFYEIFKIQKIYLLFCANDVFHPAPFIHRRVMASYSAEIMNYETSEWWKFVLYCKINWKFIYGNYRLYEHE